MKKRARALLFTLFSLSAAYIAYADTVTVSTYYPSPYGSYQTLDATTLNVTGTATTAALTVTGNTVRVGGVNVIENGGNDVYANVRVLRNSSPANQDGMYINYNSTGAANPIRFYTPGTTERMRIDNNGNVGIGTTSPAAKLAVENGWLSLQTDVTNNQTNGLTWYTPSPTPYGIYREPGGWGNPYPDLRIAFHTGIKLGANPSYNGIRFYSDWDMSSLVMAVNDASTGGANNVWVAGTVSAASDARFKTDIQTLDKVLPKLDQLRSVTYKRSKLSSIGPSDRQEMGVIGQELEKVCPELVLKNGPDEYRSVDYSRLSVVLLEAVKELKEQNERLENEMRILKEKIDA